MGGEQRIFSSLVLWRGEDSLSRRVATFGRGGRVQVFLHREGVTLFDSLQGNELC